MSVHVSSWVWKYSKCSGNELLLLIALADMANNEGVCWPSMSSLAQMCRWKDRTSVQRHLDKCIEQGEIKIVPRFRSNGSQTSNEYQFTAFEVAAGGAADERQGVPLHSGGEGRATAAGGAAVQRHLDPSLEPSFKPSKEPSIKIGKGISSFSFESHREEAPQPPVTQEQAPQSVVPEVPPAKDGELALEAEPKKNSKTAQAQEKLESFRVRVGSWFRRRAQTPWSSKELKALKEGLPALEVEIDILEALYQDKTEKYNRKNVATLLNNLPGELDRARAFAARRHGGRCAAGTSASRDTKYVAAPEPNKPVEPYTGFREAIDLLKQNGSQNSADASVITPL